MEDTPQHEVFNTSPSALKVTSVVMTSYPYYSSCAINSTFIKSDRLLSFQREI